MSRATLKAPVRRKWLSPSWLDQALDAERFEAIYEPFAGPGAVSWYFKRRGHRVVASDLLESHATLLRSAIENPGETLAPETLAGLDARPEDEGVEARFAAWAPRPFTEAQARALGRWHAAIARQPLSPNQRAVAAAAVLQLLRRWLSVRAGGGPPPGAERAPGAELAAAAADLAARRAFDNGKANRALWGDANALVPSVRADLMICYPPTDLGYLDADDETVYAEAWVKGDPDWLLPGLAEAEGLPAVLLGYPLDGAGGFEAALGAFLARAGHIPVWAIAFHDRYPLGEREMRKLIEKHRPVQRRLRLTVHAASPHPDPVETVFLA